MARYTYSHFFNLLLGALLIVFVGLYVHSKMLEREHKPIVSQYENFANGNATNNLFIKYGGLQTVQAVVDKAVANLLAEPSLANVFAVVGETGHRTGSALTAALDLQFSYLFGAPFVYPGRTFTRGAIIDARNMKSSHAGLGITTAQFNTFVQILVSTLLQMGVAQSDIDQLAPGLTSMVSDIVTVQ